MPQCFAVSICAYLSVSCWKYTLMQSGLDLQFQFRTDSFLKLTQTFWTVMQLLYCTIIDSATFCLCTFSNDHHFANSVIDQMFIK